MATEGGELIWCNARVSALAFYERAGFRTWGEEWEIPGHRTARGDVATDRAGKDMMADSGAAGTPRWSIFSNS